jgi:hypothetical protein
VSFQKEELTPETKLTVAEFADFLNLPSSAVICAIERHQTSALRPFYTFKQLADRWNCSPQNIYNILRSHEAKALDVSGGKKRSKRLVSADTVARIERLHSRPLTVL